ncbi:MAG: PilX N-terminal domain-containing pilus assembly protein [Steroidobacteraceae bacterium]
MNRASRGSALVVTLLLLSGLGALALAAAAAATVALALSGHQQYAQQAFEAAEAGLAHALAAAAETRGAGTITDTEYPPGIAGHARFHAETRETTEPGALPAGFSIGENSDRFGTRHFYIVADGEAARGARARLEQGFYFVVPAP